MTLNVPGPIKVVILTTMPDELAVDIFISQYKHQLGDPAIILDTIEMKSTNEMLAGFQRAGEIECSAILFVTHGDEMGQPGFVDPDFDALDLNLRRERKRMFLNWRNMSNWFRTAFDNRILMLAVCNAGVGNYAHALLHAGMALHVLTAYEGKEINSVDGAKAFAHFTKQLHNSGRSRITPGHVELVMNSVETSYPGILDLWPYRGGLESQKYLPVHRR